MGWQGNDILYFLLLFSDQSEWINCVKKSLTQSSSLITFKVTSLMSTLVRSHFTLTMDLRPSRSLKEDKIGSWCLPKKTNSVFSISYRLNSTALHVMFWKLYIVPSSWLLIFYLYVFPSGKIHMFFNKALKKVYSS